MRWEMSALSHACRSSLEAIIANALLLFAQVISTLVDKVV